MTIPRIALFRDECESVPMGYALAWWTAGRDSAVYLPFPLNLPARAGRQLWLACLRLTWNTRWEKMLDEAYAHGRKQSREAAEAHLKAMIASAYELGRHDAAREANL